MTIDSAECGVRSAECGVRSACAECGVPSAVPVPVPVLGAHCCASHPALSTALPHFYPRPALRTPHAAHRTPHANPAGILAC